MAIPETSAQDLDEVRSELRRLGYLNHGFGRFLLQDALRPQRPWPTLLRLTLKVGLLAGLLLALPLALGLVIANAAAEPNPLEVSLGISLVVGALGLLLALQGLRALLAESQVPLLVVLGLAAPFAIYLLIKL